MEFDASLLGGELPFHGGCFSIALPFPSGKASTTTSVTSLKMALGSPSTRPSENRNVRAEDAKLNPQEPFLIPKVSKLLRLVVQKGTMLVRRSMVASDMS